jgi:acyl dehydratase
MATMPLLLYKDLEVGRTFRPLRFSVTPELVAEYVAIVGDDNPLYERFAPPGLWGVWGRQSYLQDFEMPGGGVLAGEELVFVRPLEVGDSLDVVAEVTDLYERKGRPNVLIEITARDQSGEVAGIVRITAIWPSE